MEDSQGGNKMTLTETVHGIVCEVCNKRFSGRVPAEQHLQSESHLRKVREQPEGSTHPLWCKVCSLQCNSQQQFDSHCDSPRHQHMIEQVEIIQQQQTLTAVQSQLNDRHTSNASSSHRSSPNSLDDGTEDSAESSDVFQPINPAGCCSAPATNMNPHHDIPPGGVQFSGSRGHCYACNIELTSLQHKNQHIDGKQHKKKAYAFGSGGGLGPAGMGGASFGGIAGGGGGMVGMALGMVGASLGVGFGGGGGEVMMCAICNVPLSGDLNVHQHFASSRHKARKEELERARAGGGTSQQQPIASSSSAPFPSALPELGSFSGLRGPDSIPGRVMSFPGQPMPQYTPLTARPPSGLTMSHAATLTSPSLGSGAISPETLKVEWQTGRNQRGTCQVCDQHFGTFDEWTKHIATEQHVKRQEEIQKPGCTLCQVQYSGTASAKQHLDSHGHSHKMLMAQLSPGKTANGSSASDSSSPVVSPYKNQLAQVGQGQGPSFTSSELSHHMSNYHDLEETMKKMGIEHVRFEGTPMPHGSGTSNASAAETSAFASAMSHHETELKALNMLDGTSRPAATTAPLTYLNILPSLSNLEGATRVPFNTQGMFAASAAQATGGGGAEYVFDGSRGRCNVCGIEFTSRSHADSHLAGSKHQKAKLRWQPSTGGSAAGFGVPGQAYTQMMQQPAPNPVSPNDFHALEHKDPQLSKGIQFDGSRGYCFACRVDLTSLAHANQHLSGRKHQSAVERWSQDGEARTYPLYCDVCYKPFTGQESAAQHFSSEKHKKKVTLSQGATEGKKDPDTGALLIMRDGQMWYMCEVCKCPLNTPQQFRLHIQSPRHNSEVQKSQQQSSSSRSSPIDFANLAALIPGTGPLAPPDPSDLQHLVTRSSTVKTTPGAYVPQSQPSPFGGIIRTGSTGSSTGTSAYSSNSADNNPQQSNIKTEPGYGNAYAGTAWGTASTGGSKGTEPSRNSPSDHGNLSSSQLQNDGSLGSSASQGQGYGRGGGGYRLGEGAMSDAMRSLNIRQITRSSSQSRGGRSAGQLLRPGGDYEYDDEDSQSLPTSSSSAEYQDQDAGRQGEDEDSSMAISSVHGAERLSLTAEEKRRAMSMSAASTTSDNLTSIHTDPGSLPHLGTVPPPLGQPVSLPPPAEGNPFKNFRYSCLLCRQPMNTREDYERHMKGLKHQMKAATVRAPDKSREPLVKRDDEANGYKCCKTMPRLYQDELMRKSMATESTVVYLPTGTGKTLAAMMTISCMLTLNPTRPVLFLVDKVLLVLQQARYIINEIGEPRKFRRPHLTEEGKMEDRFLKVAVLCGGLSVRDGTPLWKHDVIVTTAAFCQNLLQDGVLRWANFSLVVFDEAHHCTKNHPYNKLLSEHHLVLGEEKRPKVLGLTASPAGRPTKEETLHMLTSLLTNLGGAQIATVEDKLAKEQLDSYSSSARLVPICVPMTEAEMGFHERLLSYYIRAYVELMRCSNLQQICASKALKVLLNTSTDTAAEEVKKFAQHLMNEPDELSDMVQLAQTARSKQTAVQQSKFDSLRMHVMHVGMTLLNSEDGIDFVIDDLERLFNPNLNKFIPELIELGLPCREVSNYVQTLCDSAKLRTCEGEGEKEGVPSSMSIFQELLVTLADEKYMAWNAEDSMALVLVRERKVAHKFKDHLKRTSFVREREMRVAVVVGHGAGSGEGEGMNLRKQDKVLQGIKSHRYNIVVATSVAEEGVDIPECQLVVCLNPPTTVKALVQMRGRARKKDSYFVVLCSSLREKEKLEDLQRQELNMKWAAQQLNTQQLFSSGAQQNAQSAQQRNITE